MISWCQGDQDTTPKTAKNFPSESPVFGPPPQGVPAGPGRMRCWNTWARRSEAQCLLLQARQPFLEIAQRETSILIRLKVSSSLDHPFCVSLCFSAFTPGIPYTFLLHPPLLHHPVPCGTRRGRWSHSPALQRRPRRRPGARRAGVWGIRIRVGDGDGFFWDLMSHPNELEGSQK